MTLLALLAVLFCALLYALGVWVLVRCGPYVAEMHIIEWVFIMLWPLAVAALVVGIIAEAAIRNLAALVRKVIR